MTPQLRPHAILFATAQGKRTRLALTFSGHLMGLRLGSRGRGVKALWLRPHCGWWAPWRSEGSLLLLAASRPALPHGSLSGAPSFVLLPAPSFLKLCLIRDEPECFGTQQTIVPKTIKKKKKGWEMQWLSLLCVPKLGPNVCVLGAPWPPCGLR